MPDLPPLREWVKYALAAAVSAYATVEALRMSAAVNEERLANHIRLEEIMRERTEKRIDRLEADQRELWRRP